MVNYIMEKNAVTQFDTLLQYQNSHCCCMKLHMYLGTRSSPKMTVVTNDLEYIAAFWLQKQTDISEQQMSMSA